MERYSGDDLILTKMDNLVERIFGIVNDDLGIGGQYLNALASAGYLDMLWFQKEQKEIIKNGLRGKNTVMIKVPIKMSAERFSKEVINLIKKSN